MADNDPTPLEHTETLIPLLDTRTVLHIGGIWGTVSSGDTWLATDGSRLVWSADGMMVIYTIKGKFYVQSSRGFIGEVTTYPWIEAARRAAPMVKLAEMEMKLLMGIVAGASGVGFAIVIGTEILEFVVENRDNFETWKRQLDVVLRTRAFLKANAPTLYDKVFSAILNKVYQDAKAKLPDAITAETVAFGVGVVLGTVGKKLAQGRFSLFALAFVIVEQLVIRFSLNVAPGALKITADEYRKLADEIIGKMRDAGVTVTEPDVRKIVEEVKNHPEDIKQAFKMLQEVFGKKEQ
jgi:hypothetical protein